MSVDPIHNNMVESKKNRDEITAVERSIEQMLVSLTKRITCKDIEFDLYQTETTTAGFQGLPDQDKKFILLRNAEKEILRFIYEQAIDVESLTYVKLKEKLIEKFASQTSMTEFFSTRQNFDEPIEQYIERMERTGKSLKLVGKVRLQVIRLGITRFPKAILEVLIGESKVTNELILKVKERESLEAKFGKLKLANQERGSLFNNNRNSRNKKEEPERRISCFSCGKPGHIATECRSGKPRKSVNEIAEEFDEMNKESFIYFCNNRIYPLFDTGSNGNYVTNPFCKKFNIKTTKMKIPQKRYTCLGESFLIKEYALIEFAYKGIKWNENFGVLPIRKDEKVLLGKDWIRAATMKTKEIKRDIPNLETLKREELKEKLFQRREEGIRLNYECAINCKEEDRVEEGATNIPQALEGRVDETVKELLKKNYIQVSNSSWCNRAKPVEKSDGSIRLTTNLIKLNQKVPLDKYSLPKIEEIIYSLKDKKYFSKIDLKDGFFQIPLRKSDTHKTAFRIKNKLYEWRRMPMGFKNAPAVFQRLMDMTLKDLLGKECFVYVDDILIVGRTQEEHDIALDKVMKKLIEAGLHGNKKKSIFNQTEVEFLGHKLTCNGIKPTISLIESIREFRIPKSCQDILEFTSLVGYYRKFIPNFSDMIEPMAKLLRKDAEFVWGQEQRKAFEKCKAAITSNTILIQPDFNKPFILTTDASNTGLGAVLAQQYGNEIKPIGFAARCLNPAERNYSITEKEMLGAIWAMEHFTYFLYGREFEIITDHKALEAFNTKGYLDSARIQRWEERIQRFNFKVTYRQGESIPHVDALSRQFKYEVNEESGVNEIKEEVLPEGQRIRKEEIMRVHEELIHRGAQAVLAKLKNEGRNEITLKEIARIVKQCEKCKMYNPIRSRATRIVEVYEVGEKVGFDIIELEKGKNIFVAIDYFTRKTFARFSDSKATIKVLQFIKDVNRIFPFKILVCDEGRENLGVAVKEWLKENKIYQHSTTPYHHQSNGRVERVIRTIREALNKLVLRGTIHERVKEVIGKYNDTYHRIIGMTPNQACDPRRHEEVKRNQYESRVEENKKFLLNGSWPTLNVGDEVIIKDELRKSKKGPRFKMKAIITEIRRFNTYLLRTENNRIIKRHMSQLKKI